MKYKRQIGGVIAASVLAVGGAGAYQLYPKHEEQALLSEVVTEVKIEEPMTEPIEEPVETPEITNPALLPASEPVVQQAPSQTSTVLSTQAYGEMYLNLSGFNQSCFNAIVAAYSHRFTKDVRERNVKALRAFADPCSTGIDIPEYRGMNKASEKLRAQNGRPEFWDGELARQYF